MRDFSAIRRARFAVSAVFLANGIIMGTWAAHIPLVEERLAISHSTLGLSLFAMAFGALMSMPLTGPTVARFGSARVTRVATMALFAAFMLPILAPDPLSLTAALFVYGAINGVMDVAMNAHAVAVERQLERPVMSSFHGMWSLGGLIGSGFAALTLPLTAPIAQAGLTVVVGAVFAVIALFFLLPAHADGGVEGTTLAWPSRATIGLGILCFLSMTSEGAIIDWGALHLKGSLELGAGLAATGFAVYAGAMAASRFSGDWLRSRFGAVELVRWSALLAAAGLGVALVAPGTGSRDRRLRPHRARARESRTGVLRCSRAHPRADSRRQHRGSRHHRLFGFCRRAAFHRLRGRPDLACARARADRGRLPCRRALGSHR